MIGRTPLRTRLTAVVLTLGAGLLPAGAADGVVAEVAGRTITADELADEMARHGGAEVFADAEARRALLEQMVERELMLAAALEAGYDRDPEALAVFERMIVARYQSDVLAARLEGVRVDDAEVEAYYRQHRDSYQRPARSRAAIIFFEIPVMASEDYRRKVEERAREAEARARELDGGETHFGALATEYSDDRASRYRGGVIGWLVEHPGRAYRWDPKVVEAVFALDEPGEIAPLVRGEDGLYLVRLVDREGVEPQPLARVEDGIRHQLLKTKRDQVRSAFFAELRSRLPVTVDRELMESIEVPESGAEDPGAEPPPLPGT